MELGEAVPVPRAELSTPSPLARMWLALGLSVCVRAAEHLQGPERRVFVVAGIELRRALFGA